MEKKFSFDVYNSNTFSISSSPPPQKWNKARDIIQMKEPPPTEIFVKRKHPPPVAAAAAMEKKKNNEIIKSIHDYSLELQNEQDAIFIKRLEETGRLSEGNARQLPDMTQELSYIASLKEQPPWYVTAQASIINSESLCFPKLDVLTREYIWEFMRSPLKGESVCANVICESERLGGFRCRVLGIRDNTWCYMCHLFTTNLLYYDSLNRKKPTDREYQINYFMVQVDVPGQYRLDRTLMGEKDVRGLYGCFPVYNTDNYTVTVLSNGCKAWIESDCMVFRLSQTTSSNQIESCSITPVQNRVVANPLRQSNPSRSITQSSISL